MVGGTPRIGVLALQGGVAEHLALLHRLGVPATRVRTPAELAAVDGLILPGGESAVMEKLARIFGLLDPLRAAIAAGLPVYGTCAGMILLADTILDAAPGQEGIGGLDAAVRRNAFGGQADSFDTRLRLAGIGEDIDASFIRAPLLESHGPTVRVLGTLPGGRIVAARSETLLVTAFHPEVSGDDRVHRYFLDMVRGRG
ncbi:pyridoxal 5'-phosphate synthase glutaminase subunit PdxT [Mycetocola spongiae]|uniref:pyridoxal 5'-phosphate synthase glutaminase subunit PdxT n=1 Tax=Mycetocola spongiae TaxID=2859226 RepID=UPI001CF477B0|nr:pyridoxal 5'-phosphate synthase glutaminase subunit PdxT [Mycetocola spongiae]UCR89562.1 pyridoxal 5'-phosphate synthase glutaminase subunit PdxT [Mycetocola spongiae]